VSVQLVAGVEILVLLAWGFTMIQVEEYVVVDVVWVLITSAAITRIAASQFTSSLVNVIASWGRPSG